MTSPQSASSSRQGIPRLALFAAALGVLCAAAGAWLHYSTRQIAQDESLLRESTDRVRAVSDALLVQGVGAGLGNRDYGEVQEALDRYAEAGCRCRAIAVNGAGKVVASVGLTPPPRIGDPSPEPMRNGARAIEVTQGGERNGRLYVESLDAPMPPPAWRMLDTMRSLAVALALLAWAAALVLVWRSHRRGHSTAASPYPVDAASTVAATAAAPEPEPEPGRPPSKDEIDARIRQHLAKLRERRQQRSSAVQDRTDAA